MSVNKLTIKELYDKDDIRLLSDCKVCPRECRVDRFKGGTGYCLSDAGTNIASICIHRGEEPPISGPDGICNIFFSGCNMRCVYCQNHEISRHGAGCRNNMINFDKALGIITGILDKGIKAVGFVSPSHVVPQVKTIIKILNSQGYKPVTVYNTNSYDKANVIKSLDGIIDVYLPDYKYVTQNTARELSDTNDYPNVAHDALKEMYRQKGSVFLTDPEGRVERGLLIRHLVLPGHAGESKKVLRTLAEEISTGVSISLMSQYHPTPMAMDFGELGRTIYRSEYQEVVEEMERLGFRNGWVQDMESHQNYRPDFRKENPFE